MKWYQSQRLPESPMVRLIRIEVSYRHNQEQRVRQLQLFSPPSASFSFHRHFSEEHRGRREAYPRQSCIPLQEPSCMDCGLSDSPPPPSPVNNYYQFTSRNCGARTMSGLKWRLRLTRHCGAESSVELTAVARRLLIHLPSDGFFRVE